MIVVHLLQRCSGSIMGQAREQQLFFSFIRPPQLVRLPPCRLLSGAIRPNQMATPSSNVVLTSHSNSQVRYGISSNIWLVNRYNSRPCDAWNMHGTTCIYFIRIVRKLIFFFKNNDMISLFRPSDPNIALNSSHPTFYCCNVILKFLYLFDFRQFSEEKPPPSQENAQALQS